MAYWTSDGKQVCLVHVLLNWLIYCLTHVYIYLTSSGSINTDKKADVRVCVFFAVTISLDALMNFLAFPCPFQENEVGVKAIHEVHETRHCREVPPEPLQWDHWSIIVMRCAEFVVFMCTVEEQICKEIFKLQHYRQLGITTFKGEWSSFFFAVSDTLTLSYVHPGAKLYEKLQVQRRQQTSMQKELMRKKCSTEVRILYSCSW